MQTAGLQSGLLETFSAVSNFISIQKEITLLWFLPQVKKTKEWVCVIFSPLFDLFFNSDVLKYFTAVFTQGRAEGIMPQFRQEDGTYHSTLWLRINLRLKPHFATLSKYLNHV